MIIEKKRVEKGARVVRRLPFLKRNTFFFLSFFFFYWKLTAHTLTDCLTDCRVLYICVCFFFLSSIILQLLLETSLPSVRPSPDLSIWITSSTLQSQRQYNARFDIREQWRLNWVRDSPRKPTLVSTVLFTTFFCLQIYSLLVCFWFFCFFVF